MSGCPRCGSNATGHDCFPVSEDLISRLTADLAEARRELERYHADLVAATDRLAAADDFINWMRRIAAVKCCSMVERQDIRDALAAYDTAKGKEG